MPSTALDFWWVHLVRIERVGGSGAAGTVYLPAEVSRGFWDDSTRRAVDAEGVERVISGTLYLPIDIDAVPVGSVVFSPWSESEQATVVNTKRHDVGGKLPVEHYELMLG